MEKMGSTPSDGLLVDIQPQLIRSIGMVASIGTELLQTEKGIS